MSQITDIIKSELAGHVEIKAVSFDVFDTLLFRTAIVPDRVIWNMYRKKRKAFPEFTTIGDWVSSRRIAEQEARRESKRLRGHGEISLKDIYQCLPTVYSNIDELMQLEIECECEMGVLNAEAKDIIRFLCEECKKDILLISDMYLNSEQIGSILQSCGLDLSFIKKLYVSSEFSGSKKDGKLFQLVLDEQRLCPGELLHVGDNLQSDIVAAKRLGIRTCYYNFISERYFTYPFLFYEQEFFGAPLSERLYLTRLFAGQKNQEATAKEQFFFTVGSMIMGPFLTYAAEWVIDTALKEKIYKIRPFMREGRFLARLLQAAQKNRGADLSIEPIYISRFAAYSSRFSDITPKEIIALAAGARVTPQDVFRMLQIEDLLYHFEQYSDSTFTELKAFPDSGGGSVYSVILNYLSSPEVLDIIHERNRGKKNIFIDYLKQMGLTDSAVTLDIGWNGTTMKAVYQAVHECNPDVRLLQLLFCSSKNVARNSVDGCVIKGFVGNYGGHQGKFNQIFIPIFELFCLCDEGPTIGYKYCEQGIMPITDKNVFSSEWLANIAAVQRGVMAYQKEYFAVQKKRNIKNSLKEQGIQALSMIERLFTYPLFQEVEYLKTAELDQNIGIEERAISVLDTDLCKQYRELGTEQFFRFFRNLQQSVTWHQALPVLNNPLIHLKMVYLQKAKYGKLSTILLIEYAVKTAGKGEIVIVIDEKADAVDLALLYFKCMGAMDKVSGIASMNECMQGILYNGIPVSSLHAALHAEVYFIPVKERYAYNLLKEQIIKEKGMQAKIIGYFESDLGDLDYEG